MTAATGPLRMRGGTPAEHRVQKLNEREALRAAAALYRMIAQAFSNPQAGSLEAARCTALDLIDAALRGLLPSTLLPHLRALLRAWQAVSTEELTAEYSRLFLGSGLVPLREGGYGDGMRFAGQPVDIADLNGFYLAFGFELPRAARNPPDHLGTEVEFVSLLYLKKVLALERGRLRESRIVDHALGRFLEDHLGRWVAAFQTALGEANAIAPYALPAKFLRAAVAADCIRLRVKPVAAGPGNAHDPVGDETLVCPWAKAEAVSR